MKFSVEDLQKIKLPLSRMDFDRLGDGQTPPLENWPKDLLKEYDRVMNEEWEESGYLDWD